MFYNRLLVLTAIAALAACNEKVEVEEPDVGDNFVEEAPGEDPLFIGEWAAEPSMCDAAPGAPGPVRITAGEFIGYENQCVFNSVEEGTEGGWRIEWTCQAEGMEIEETADIDIDGDRLMLSRNAGPAVEFVRCGAVG